MLELKGRGKALALLVLAAAWLLPVGPLQSPVGYTPASPLSWTDLLTLLMADSQSSTHSKTAGRSPLWLKQALRSCCDFSSGRQLLNLPVRRRWSPCLGCRYQGQECCLDSVRQQFQAGLETGQGDCAVP